MRTYRYRALNAQGHLALGTMVARDQLALRKQLTEQRLELIRAQRCWLPHQSIRPLSLEQQQLLAYEWATLLEAGLGMADVISAEQQQGHRGTRGALIEQLCQSLRVGLGLSQALERSGMVQGRFVAAVRAGEHSGQLSLCLHQLSELFAGQHKLQRDLQQAMLYPALTAMVMLAVCGYLLTSLVPQLRDFLHALGIGLPWYSRALIACSDWFSRYGLWLLLALVSGLLAIGLSYRYSPPLALCLDRLCLRLPVWGALRCHAEYAQLWRQLGLLYSAGINWLDNIEQAIQASSNQLIRQQLAKVAEALSQGSTLSLSVAALSALQANEARLLKTAENSGTLTQVLAALAARRHQALQQSLAQMLALVQPMMMLLLGGFMIWLVLSVLLPLYDFSALGEVGQ